MQKLSQTEELARTLAARARHHALTPEQISRAMDEQDYDVAQLDELYTALEDRGVHLTEEEADLPALDETQIGRLEHELSAEGVALDDPVKAYLKEIGRNGSVKIWFTTTSYSHGSRTLRSCFSSFSAPSNL